MNAYDTLTGLNTFLEYFDEVSRVRGSGLGKILARQKSLHEAGSVDVDAFAEGLFAEINHLGDHRDVQWSIDLGGQHAGRVRHNAGHDCLLAGK